MAAALLVLALHCMLVAVPFRRAYEDGRGWLAGTGALPGRVHPFG